MALKATAIRQGTNTRLATILRASMHSLCSHDDCSPTKTVVRVHFPGNHLAPARDPIQTNSSSVPYFHWRACQYRANHAPASRRTSSAAALSSVHPCGMPGSVTKPSRASSCLRP